MSAGHVAAKQLPAPVLVPGVPVDAGVTVEEKVMDCTVMPSMADAVAGFEAKEASAACGVATATPSGSTMVAVTTTEAAETVSVMAEAGTPREVARAPVKAVWTAALKSATVPAQINDAVSVIEPAEGVVVGVAGLPHEQPDIAEQ